MTEEPTHDTTAPSSDESLPGHRHRQSG
jgi:hypothetical protein